MYDCMYDCVSIEPTIKPAKIDRKKRIALHLQHRDHHRLQLKLAPGTAPHRLNLAYAAASSLGWPTQLLDDGSLLILDIHLHEALMFQRRFQDLLAHFEPARHRAG